MDARMRRALRGLAEAMDVDPDKLINDPDVRTAVGECERPAKVVVRRPGSAFDTKVFWKL